jgi:hypothetical protein
MITAYKKNINTYVPLAIALYVAYAMYKRKETPQMVGLYSIISWIGSYFVVSSIVKQIEKQQVLDELGNVGSISNYDPSNIVTKLHDDIYCIICLRNIGVYDELLSLADVDIIKVAKAYYAKYNVSLAQDIEDEISVPFADPFDQVKITVRKKFKTLNLL